MFHSVSESFQTTFENNNISLAEIQKFIARDQGIYDKITGITKERNMQSTLSLGDHIKRYIYLTGKIY